MTLQILTAELVLVWFNNQDIFMIIKANFLDFVLYIFNLKVIVAMGIFWPMFTFDENPQNL